MTVGFGKIKNSFGAVVGAKDTLEEVEEWMEKDFWFQIISMLLLSKMVQNNKENKNRNILHIHWKHL